MNELTDYYSAFLSNPFNAAIFILLALTLMLLAFFRTKSVIFQAWSFYTFVGAIGFVTMIHFSDNDLEIVHGPLVVIENGELNTPDNHGEAE